jgi:signal peptidase I
MTPEPSTPDCPLWRRLVFGRRPKRTLMRAALIAVSALIVFKFVLLPVRIQGGSMLPAYRSGSINFINQLAYLWHKPRRGDVVGVMMTGKHLMLFKRIVALPGETVAIERGFILINGHLLSEPYVQARAPWQLTPRQLEPDEYFVVGDNRGMDQQVHEFGAAKARKIVGKVLW